MEECLRKMEVAVNQWKETENEAEEVGLQPRRGHLRRRSSSSDNDREGFAVDYANEFSGLKGGGLESETKEKFDVRTENLDIRVNAEIILQNGDTGKGIILPVSDPPIPEGSTSFNTVTTETGGVGTMKENELERHELYLESVFQKPPTHGFYCPNCKACIQTVLIQKGDHAEQITAHAQPVQPTDTIRCSSCFSFLIPIGRLLFPGLVSCIEDGDGAPYEQVTDTSNNYNEGSGQTLEGASQYPLAPDQSVPKSPSKLAVDNADDPAKQIQQHNINGAGEVASEVEDKIKGTGLGSILNMTLQGSSGHLSVISQDHRNGQATSAKKPLGPDWAPIPDSSDAFLPKKPEIDSSEKGDWGIIATGSEAAIPKQPVIDFQDKLPEQPQFLQVTVDGGDTGPAEPAVQAERTPLLPCTEPPLVQEPASSKPLEILKSIVYGGLTESLASLSVVTSAASADATTLSIVALAIANLIGGLFVLGHNLGELKLEQPRRAENQTDAPVDRYHELLGQRDNFFLHASVAILSFIVFGLVPPVVYGFSFHESDDKDFKLAAVAGASVLCITLLSIAKAYIRRTNSYGTYFKTVLFYVSTGAVASVLSYVAGDLVKKLVEKLGWFESGPDFDLQVPGMSIEKPGWGSY